MLSKRKSSHNPVHQFLQKVRTVSFENTQDLCKQEIKIEILI